MEIAHIIPKNVKWPWEVHPGKIYRQNCFSLMFPILMFYLYSLCCIYFLNFSLYCLIFTCSYIFSKTDSSLVPWYFALKWTKERVPCFLVFFSLFRHFHNFFKNSLFLVGFWRIYTIQVDPKKLPRISFEGVYSKSETPFNSSLIYLFCAYFGDFLYFSPKFLKNFFQLIFPRFQTLIFQKLLKGLISNFVQISYLT